MSKPGGALPSGKGAPPRVVITAVRPSVEGGAFPAKAVEGEPVRIEADAVLDGHDLIFCEARVRHRDEGRWQKVAMTATVNDTYAGLFVPRLLGPYRFRVYADLDRFASLLADLTKKAAARQLLELDLADAAALVRGRTTRATGADRRAIEALAEALERGGETALEDLGGALPLLRRNQDRRNEVASGVFELHVEQKKAGFSTWYELFPRSAAAAPGRHGTFDDVIGRLEDVARMGFDVLYLPPVHPIGTTKRKGRNGAVVAGPEDPGSPWAIGSPLGGHTAVHPELGTLKDFDRLVAAARRAGLDVALDIAFQCSPDHPWVTSHPEWFKHRSDGSVQYAENPPKRYEDIYPLDFETPAWAELWGALCEVVEFWIAHGVRIFRVDNPHTKPFRFWQWLIARIQSSHPETVFLAEAFTRPKVMHHLAKIGFSQSYTYFAWRNTKWELETYLGELTSGEVPDYFRPNFWPNTPDILTAELQHGGRPTFALRLLLAATAAANYGIYGPAFELQIAAAREPGSEEYLDSEKYAVAHWPLASASSLSPLISTINRIRSEHLALQQTRTLRLHLADNDQILVFSKTALPEIGRTDDHPHRPHDLRHAPIVVVVNLDPVNRQSAWVVLDLDALGIDPERPYVAHDLLGGASYVWQGRRNFVILDPAVGPGHVLRLEAARS